MVVDKPVAAADAAAARLLLEVVVVDFMVDVVVRCAQRTQVVAAGG
jgi:hypothetical protein